MGMLTPPGHATIRDIRIGTRVEIFDINTGQVMEQTTLEDWKGDWTTVYCHAILANGLKVCGTAENPGKVLKPKKEPKNWKYKNCYIMPVDDNVKEADA